MWHFHISGLCSNFLLSQTHCLGSLVFIIVSNKTPPPAMLGLQNRAESQSMRLAREFPERRRKGRGACRSRWRRRAAAWPHSAGRAGALFRLPGSTGRCFAWQCDCWARPDVLGRHCSWRTDFLLLCGSFRGRSKSNVGLINARCIATSASHGRLGLP